jgi:acyl-CoA synthetase (AMP-forming)/AMP-acid ligase II
MLIGSLLLRHAVEQPDKPAVVDGGRVVSFRDLARQAAQAAQILADAGIGQGSRLGLLAENCAEFLVLVGAAALTGASLVPINTRLHSEEIASILADAGVPLCLVGPGVDCDVITAPGVELRTFQHGEFAASPGARSGFAAWPARTSDSLMQYYTGGTTGTPKGCLITHGNLLAQASNFQSAIGLSQADRYGLLMPFYHMAAGGMAVAVMALGGTCVLLPRADGAALLHAIERNGVTRTNLPAAVLRDLRDGDHLRPLPGLRWLGTGNGTETALIRLLSEVVCRDVRGWYGQTEATNITTAPRSTEEALTAFGCIGRPAGTARVRVVRQDGSDAGDDEVGELWTAGPHVMAGYWRRPEETGAALQDGWLRSGDLVRRTAHGSLVIVDRLKEVIKSGGESIYPREVEQVLERHPAVAEAAIIGIRHARWSETPLAIVVLRDGRHATADELIRFCRGHLAAFKRPTSVVFTDRLPRNVAGKVRKDVLRQAWGNSSSAAVQACVS